MNLNEGKPPLDERATSPESQHERPHQSTGESCVVANFDRVAPDAGNGASRQTQAVRDIPAVARQRTAAQRVAHPIITLFGQRVEVTHEGVSAYDGTRFMSVRPI